ncbi:lipopolysaccharide biosynthesis protein [Terrihabitans sp. B22-R8]|uniref:lipopolysaccharide biosynthesis protein n=1 Tax=Terrihabitans sp. B22-R8 TaxID=3425128 RepID=UPI00403CE95C
MTEFQTETGGLRARLRAWTRDGGDLAMARRMASTTFLLRVVNAALALVLQVALARWMGAHEYGIYAYAWVWVLLAGGLSGLGLSAASQRLVPEYQAAGDEGARLRGFLTGGGALAFVISAAFATLGAIAVSVPGWVADEFRTPLLIACLCTPFFVLMDFQEGIARAFHWAGLAFVPPYFVQPLLILCVAFALFAAGRGLDAAGLMWISLAAILVAGIGQFVVLRGRLSGRVPSGRRVLEVRRWLRMALPLLLMNGFYLLLTYVDVLILERFHPPGDVAHYFAATKIMAVMSFIVFAVQAACAARFAGYHVAGEREKLAAFARQARRWTFWPSLAAALGLLVLGQPLLWLFGPDFTTVFYLLPIMAAGLLARAAAGPVEPLLAMAGEERATAWTAGGALLLNLVLNLALIPLWGLAGAALATSLALAAQAVAMTGLAHRRLGIRLL